MEIEYIMIFVFILGYVAIAMEHNIHINKTASALIVGMMCWALYAIWPAEHLNLDTTKTVTELAADPELRAHHPDLAAFMEHAEGAHLQNKLANPEHPALKATSHNTPEETAHYVNDYVEHGLAHHIYDIAGILLFLLGAMTIVELIDAHSGFEVITKRITAVKKVNLLWVISLVTFFLSATLDNLTTAIVMISVIRKLVDEKEIRWIFGGFIILAANAGGAWSPIGDVTTTMLWNNGQLPDTMPLISHVFLPSFISLLVPLILASIFMKGAVTRPSKTEHRPGHEISAVTNTERNLIFFVGLGALLFVPVFKTITHLPPFAGMMMSLGIVWLISELMLRRKEDDQKKGLSVISVLQKIDTSSVLFFLGILLAVAALQEVGHLTSAAHFLDKTLNGNMFAINISIGALSAVIDNVPLVAAAQGMYPVAATGDFAANGSFWQFLAYCAGTGGSMLIIGSAAGVAVMGLEKISFGWYLKRMTGYAAAGYVAGCLVFYLTLHV